MRPPLRITRVSVTAYGWEVPGLGVDYNGFNQVWEAGARRTHVGHVLRIDTDAGITGEYVGGMTARLRPGRQCSPTT